jgi:hypothetical protein
MPEANIREESTTLRGVFTISKMSDRADLAKAFAFHRRMVGLCSTRARPSQIAAVARDIVAFTTFDVTCQHAQAIDCLVHNKLDSSARALLRPFTEASLRTQWLLWCATDEQIEAIRLKDDGAYPRMGLMAKALDQETQTGTFHTESIACGLARTRASR